MTGRSMPPKIKDKRFRTTTAKISSSVVGLSGKVVVFRFLIWDTAVLLFSSFSSDFGWAEVIVNWARQTVKLSWVMPFGLARYLIHLLHRGMKQVFCRWRSQPSCTASHCWSCREKVISQAQPSQHCSLRGSSTHIN